MITIKKTKAGFHAVTTGKNNKVLQTSEVEKTRRSVIKNIAASLIEYNNFRSVIITDDRGWEIVVYASNDYDVIKKPKK